jgi:hypothetical protein
VPAIDVEVWRLDAQGEPRLLHRTLRSSASRGSVRVDDVDAVWQSGLEADLSRRRGFDGELKHPDLPDLERTRLRVALARDLAPSAWAEIDLALDPLPHVTLRFPPLGELRVTVADAGGNPVSWAGGVELRAEGPRDATFSRELVDGRAEFTTLPFHTAFLAHAVRSDGARGEAVRVAPFAHDEPVREHVLPDVAAQARLRARPIHPDGFALPRTWCEVRFVSPRPAPEPEPTRSDTVVSQLQAQALRELGYTEEPSGRLDGVTRRIRSMPYRTAPKASESPAAHELRRVWTTDETGFLDVPLPAGLQELRDVTVFVSLVRDGRTLSSEPIRFQRGAAWGDLDLGPVPLLGPEPESEQVK